MKQRLLFLWLLPLLCTAVHAQEKVPGLEPAFVFTRSGEALSGYILGMDSDSLTLVKRLPVRVARSDIARIVVKKQDEQWRGFVTGTLLSWYTMNVAFGLAHGQPGSFLNSKIYTDDTQSFNGFAALLIALPSMGLGGGIGVLVDPGNNPATVFWFAGERDEQQQEWERFARYISGADKPSAVRITLVSAGVVGGMNAAFERVAGGQGMKVGARQNVSPAGIGNLDPAVNFNLTRRLQITCDLWPSVEVGAAMLWLGEPVMNARRERRIITQVADGRGYYAVGMYTLPLTRTVAVAMGGGIGVARMSVRLVGEEWPDYTGNGRSIQAQADVARTSFSTLLLAEGTVRLYDHLSLGLTADYALIPIAMEVPGLPELDLPAQTVMPGNLGIGVVLALHF